MFKYFLANLQSNARKFKIHIATITTTANMAYCADTGQTGQSDKFDVKVDFPCYTTEQQQKILEIINASDLENLLNYRLSKSRAAKLSAWKKRNGPLQQVDDILLVEGFGIKTVEKFYRSMLEDHIPNSKAKKTFRERASSFITPHITAEQRHAIRSCVSVRIGVSHVNCARVELPPQDLICNAPCLLTHWQHHEIKENKLHLGDLVQRLLYITHQIPMADCYVFENPQMAQINTNPGSAEQQNISMQKAQITAVLAYEFYARSGRDVTGDAHERQEKMSTISPYPNVFFLRRFLTARLFNQLVGTERVSSEDTIVRLMRIYYNLDPLEKGENEGIGESIHSKVQFPLELRKMFAGAERYQREFLGQSLLLNLAFVRLVLYQDEESIAAVTRSPNKKNLHADLPE